MKQTSICMLIAMSLASFTPAAAATVLKTEPAAGKLPAGETVLVDNGKCPKGQIQAVTGGGNRSLNNGSRTVGSKRTYQCVRRP